MRTLLIFLALVAGAETNSASESPWRSSTTSLATMDTTEIDVQSWVEDVLAALDSEHSIENRDAEIKRLADSLDAALDWRRVCDTYWGGSTQQEVYDPMPRDNEQWARGFLELAHIRGDAYLVAVTCHFGAYQGAYALVHVVGDEARLVHAPDLDANAQPTDRQTAVFSTPRYRGLNDGHFQTFGKSRGMGDCGTLVSYHLVASGLATILEVRHQRCDYDGDPIINSDEWPVVYRADG